MSVRTLARKLGISATAVSLALKNSPRVSAQMRTLVQRLAKESGYVPNARLAELMNEVRRSVSQRYRATLGAFSLYPEEEPWRTRPHLKTVLQSAAECAHNHGYEMAYLWMKRPGMTLARFRSIIDARGIQGLFCLGSMDPEEEIPAELLKFAIITFAASIPSKLHRVRSHFEADARQLFNELLRRGYKRPGLAMLVHGDRRTDYAYSASYLSAQERLFCQSHLPILRSDTWDEPGFGYWFEIHRPDVVVLHQSEEYIAGVETWLKRRRLTVPRDVGLALLDKNPQLARYAGVCQDYGRMGATAAEMLIGRLLLRDFSAPEHPKVELVIGDWNEGRTLRAVPGERRTSER